jgi:hypothetical protein
MKYELADPSVDALVVQTQQTYQKVLVQWGLLDFTRNEMARARISLRSGGQTRIHLADARFQAAVTRLRSRKDISSQTVDAALRELMDAEYDCDQALWERDCHRVVMMKHLHFKRAIPLVVPKAPVGG